jgi:hypothetical protein
MFNSAIARSGSQVLSANATFLNKVLASAVPQRHFASVAFNVKSKFEAAFQAKQTAKGAVTSKKE